MASELAYEASDEASESELLDKSLSLWKGWSLLDIKEDFVPVPLDIYTASSIGHFDCIRSLILRENVDLDRKNKGGWTPLMYACYIGHDNIVNLLLEADVNVNVKNHKGQTPLMLASSCGNESVGYFLCQSDAELEARDKRGWTALFHATYAGHQKMVLFLLEQDANINAVEPHHGLTPFMAAAAEGHEIIVQIFLQHGVDINAKAYNGDTARSLALIYGHMKIVSLIDNHMVPIICLRSEAGLECQLSSSDEAYSRPRHLNRPRSKGRGPSIRDGPDAIARLIDRTRTCDGKKYPNVPKGYVTFGEGKFNQGDVTKLSYRDVTSPINPQDCTLDSSADSFENDEDGNAFSKTGAITIKSSSSSSGGLVAALGISRENSLDSDDFQQKCVITNKKETENSMENCVDCNEKVSLETEDSHKIKDKIKLRNSKNIGGISNLQNFQCSSPTENFDDHKIDVPSLPKSCGFSEVPTDIRQKSDKPILNLDLKNNFQSTSVSEIQEPAASILPESISECSETLEQKVGRMTYNHLENITAKSEGILNNIPETFSKTAGTVLLSTFQNSGSPQDPMSDMTKHVPDTLTCDFGFHVPKTTVEPSVDSPLFEEQKQALENRPKDLGSLLEQLGLSKYSSMLEQQDVDLHVFLSLTDNDLKEIGVKLFGPRKKMTNAIARWHSNAKPATGELEQAYADRLEGEMQELALQMHQAYDQVEKLKAQVMQEQQLRGVTESCLMEERQSWQTVQHIMFETRQKYDEMKESLRKLKYCHAELKDRLLHGKDGPEQHLYHSGQGSDSSVKESNFIDEKNKSNNEMVTLSSDSLIMKMDNYTKELQQTLGILILNTDRLLGRMTKSQYSMESGFS